LRKVLILANNDVGLYRFRRELIQALVAQGDLVFIALPEGEMVKPLIGMGCTFINTSIDRRGKSLLNDMKLLMNYLNLVRKVKPDLVVTYTIKPNVYGALACRVLRVRHILNITGLGTSFQKRGMLRGIVTLLYKQACKKARVVFFENQANRDMFVNKKILDKSAACVLHCADVNLEEYQPSQYPPTDEVRFLFIGRIRKEEGVDEFFHVARRIRREYNNVYFDVIGQFEDDYSERVFELEREGFIKFHGFQKDVRPFIRNSHCFVLPSYHEGMANSLLECGAMGRSIITTNVPGCKEAVINNETGYLVNVMDQDDLYHKVKKYIELPKNEKLRMGVSSREHVARVFDRKKIVEATLEEINQL